MNDSLLAAASAYVRGGLSLIPVGREKRPFTDALPRDSAGKPTWRPFQSAAADRAMVAGWCGTPGVTGVAVVCGAISGGVLIIDCDEPRLYEAWRVAVGPLADGLPVQKTGKGFQVAVRCDDPGANQALAWVPDETNESGRTIGIETRGEGGYALLPGSLHPNGKIYTCIAGDFAAIPRMEMAQVHLLLAAARQLNEAPQSKQELEKARKAPIKSRASVRQGGDVIGQWNLRIPIHDMLKRAGYKVWRDRYTRPGDDASPGSVVVFDDSRSFHHSTNDPLHGSHSHDSFSVYCETEHAGDVKAAVKAAASELGLANSGTDVGSVGVADGKAPLSWPGPKPLPEALPPVQPFDPALLPERLAPWVKDIADRIQCPIDFSAVTAMVVISSLVGRKVGIRPKRQDDWTAVPNLWGAIIGRPGVMKTPAIQEPLKPVKKLEIEAKQEYDAKAAERDAESRVAEIEEKERDKEIRKNLKNKDEALRLARESIDDGSEKPIRKRYVVNDSTVEKLGEILNQNPTGVLYYRDELIGFLISLDKEGQEQARSFFLECWNGNGRYTFDRIGRGTVDVEAAIISIIGGIQPGPLAQYLRAANREGKGDDGLIQRFQLAVWPDVSKTWVNVDRSPDGVARAMAYEVFEGLAHFEADLVGADSDATEPDGIPFLRFSEDAQHGFDNWRAGLETKLRSDELQPALESHLAKYRSLVPSLALLIHLADGGRNPVGLAALQKAIRWCEYLESHARRIYAQAVHPDVAATRALARKILSGEVADGFALRDIYRKGWSCLSTQEEAKGAVELLIDLDWLVETKKSTEGRTATVYVINRRLPGSVAAKNLRSPSGGTDRTDKSGGPPPSGGSVSGPQGGEAKPEQPGSDWGEVP